MLYPPNTVTMFAKAGGIRLYEETLRRMRAEIAQLVVIPDEEWAFLLSRLEYPIFPKGAFLARPGEMADEMHTVMRDAVRIFYADGEGKELNKQFGIEFSTVGSYSSLIFGQPCRYYIQALEDTTTACCSKALIDHLYERHPCWERMGRLGAQQYLLFKEKREEELIMNTLEERYQNFLREYPGLDKRIPQYHIASYLGVTDVALSRMRSRLKGNS